LTAWIAALAATALVAAAERQDGPGIPFQDTLASKLEGRWKVVRNVRGKEMASTSEVGWVLQHQFLRMHMASVEPGYEADVYIGMSNAGKHYVIHWMDVWGGHFAMSGKGRREGDAIEFRFTGDGGDFYNTFTYDRGTDRWSMNLENADKAGKRSPFATERWERLR
jgi:hypothetical protein